MTIDISPEAVECLWEDYLTAATPDGCDNTGVIELYDIEGMNEAAHSMFEALCALSAALTASQAETAAAYEAAAKALDEVAANWDCGHDIRSCDCAMYIEQWGFAADECRALTPADSKAALDRMLAEARADGMREAADKLILVGKDEYTNDFNRGFDRGIEWSRNAILAAIPKGQANE